MADDYHPERVPGAETATAHEDKFLKYLVDETKPKAGIFKPLGFDDSNWDVLREAMLTQLPFVPGRYSRGNYTAVMEISGPSGTREIKTVWAVNPESPPHFVTAVPVKGSRTRHTSQ